MATVKPPAYTGAGDIGTTCLCYLPKKISKAALRLDAIGDVDELNSVIGICRLYNKDKNFDSILGTIQSNIFKIGAELASVGKNVRMIKSTDTNELEITVNKFHRKLPVLRNFILPRGSPIAAHLHFARTVCRRAERKIVALNEREKVSTDLLKYINRLSSLLFVLARWANKQGNVKEIEWKF